MANDFRSSIGAHRNESMRSAMASLSGGSAFDGVISGSAGSNLDSHRQALEKARAWRDQKISAVSDFGSQQTAMAANTAQQGMEMAASSAAHQANLKAAKAANKASQTAGIGSLIGQGVGIGAMLLCERRLKTAIEPLPVEDAWTAVRDIPLYSFVYKQNPGRIAYGPMVDEVEEVDPTLVRDSLLPNDAAGPIRGFDVMRYQALESVALQHALKRIEQLETRLARLELTESLTLV